ncbi:ADP-ribosylglycohydrolase family protein [Arthrobacter sp. zg-Y859]|uniref:ADP-ribosylglycohydrolase family protein n=1 Tax=Arthrobacter jinronghuae TaxID=2964609 RepID=A0ABT1NPV2_9MICC|nr:ADP-ribosylglycohydrolase family protein [Arthrobacter jinronghuae]MCQ1949622.1 ADP-ribosylglycohydrolase family protein [Arthrobacter jinronghuae]UWX77612.1 ADP-ribosylglycohydrolase family protein [Arthrobacter jinronghuae]
MIPEPDSAPVFLSSAALSAKIRGCLLGGALGDAAAAASGPASASSTSITADTQLALYSLDGLLEAIEWANQGVGADETACIWLAYLRWMRGRGLPLPENGPSPLPRPIDAEPLLQPAGTEGDADLDPDVLQALSTGEMGTRQRPLNTGVNTPAALVRSAPFGLLPYVETETVYKLALDAASLTHGHPSARHSAAVFASMVHGLLAPGAKLRSAATEALAQARANGVPELADRLQAVLDDDGGAGAAAAGTSGGTPTSEEALAIGLHAAQAVEDAADAAAGDGNLSAATGAAIRDAATAGGTPAAVVTGSLLGTRYGTLPETDLETLRERGVIEKLASGFVAATVAP